MLTGRPHLFAVLIASRGRSGDVGGMSIIAGAAGDGTGNTNGNKEDHVFHNALSATGVPSSFVCPSWH